MTTERQEAILRAIVQLYIYYEEPIGSKKLLDEMDLSYSSATVRNDMKKLEDLGYIEKTHTSSGRVPTEQGYRYYVDYLLEEGQFKPAEKQDYFQHIQQGFYEPFFQMEDIVMKTADILSQITNYTAFVLGPQAKLDRLKQFQMIPITENRMMAVVMTDNNDLENMVIQLPDSVDQADIQRAVHIINEELVGLTLNEVNQKLEKDIPFLLYKYLGSTRQIVDHVIENLSQRLGSDLHVSGQMRLLDAMSGMPIEEMKSIFQLIENRQALYPYLDLKDTHSLIQVTIGKEFNSELLERFSLVTARYYTGSYGDGLLAVLGPKNMSYGKTIQILNDFQLFLPEIIKKLDHQDDE